MTDGSVAAHSSSNQQLAHKQTTMACPSTSGHVTMPNYDVISHEGGQLITSSPTNSQQVALSKTAGTSQGYTYGVQNQVHASYQAPQLYDPQQGLFTTHVLG